MKKIYLALFATLSFHSFLHAQWTTIYEAGSGTSIDLDQEWGARFYFEAPGGSSNANTIFGTPGSSNNGVRLFYYTSDFGSGTAGIYKQIPGMENYASLRIYVESDLPDSIGSMTYAKLNNEEFLDGLGNPLWHEFASDQIGQTIPFSNQEGNDMIYLFADLLRGDSISFKIHYVRIEADTTQFVSVPTINQNGFLAFSSGSTLHVQTQNEEQPFTLNLYNSSGANVYQTTTSGSQNIPVDYEAGIYYAYITFEDAGVKQFKVFIE
jgi:hypothetical protein